MNTAAQYHCPSLNKWPFRMPNSMMNTEWPFVQARTMIFDTITRILLHMNSYVEHVEIGQLEAKLLVNPIASALPSISHLQYLSERVEV